MQIVQPTFGVNYGSFDQNDSLDVRFNVWDCSGVAPVFVGQITGDLDGFGCYSAEVAGVAGKLYLVIGMVYSAGVPNVNRSPGAETYLTAVGEVAALEFGINYAAYDLADDLDVTAHVYEDQAEIDTMTLDYVELGVYFGKYGGIIGHSYVIASLVDGDPNRSPGLDNYDAVSFTGGSGFGFCEAVLVGQSTDAILEGPCD